MLLEGDRRRQKPSTAVAATAMATNQAGKHPTETHRASAEKPGGAAGTDAMDECSAVMEESHIDRKDNPAPDVEMDSLAGALSALQFVPSSVRFGRGGKRGGFARK